MALNFLEQLAAEWYEYRGYFVRRNVPGGKLPRGGYECELDVVAFHPETKDLVHVEPSMDAESWEKRARRYEKKFEAGRRHIPKIFSGVLTQDATPRQMVLLDDVKTRPLTSGKVVCVSAFLKPISDEFSDPKITTNVPEQFPILRAIWYIAYYRKNFCRPVTVSGTSVT